MQALGPKKLNNIGGLADQKITERIRFKPCLKYRHGLISQDFNQTVI